MQSTMQLIEKCETFMEKSTKLIELTNKNTNNYIRYNKITPFSFHHRIKDRFNPNDIDYVQWSKSKDWELIGNILFCSG